MDIHCAVAFCVALLVLVIMAVALRAAASYFAPNITIPQPIMIIIGCIILLFVLLYFFNCVSGGGSMSLFHR